MLAGCNDSKVITELLLLQVSLRQILELTLGEFEFCGTSDRQLCSVSGDDDVVGSQCPSLASDLDMIMEVFLEKSNIQNLIVHWLCAVNDKLNNVLLSLDLDEKTDLS